MQILGWYGFIFFVLTQVLHIVNIIKQENIKDRIISVVSFIIVTPVLIFFIKYLFN